MLLVVPGPRDADQARRRSSSITPRPAPGQGGRPLGADGERRRGHLDQERARRPRRTTRGPAARRGRPVIRATSPSARARVPALLPRAARAAGPAAPGRPRGAPRRGPGPRPVPSVVPNATAERGGAPPTSGGQSAAAASSTAARAAATAASASAAVPSVDARSRPVPARRREQHEVDVGMSTSDGCPERVGGEVRVHGASLPAPPRERRPDGPLARPATETPVHARRTGRAAVTPVTGPTAQRSGNQIAISRSADSGRVRAVHEVLAVGERQVAADGAGRGHRDRRWRR